MRGICGWNARIFRRNLSDSAADTHSGSLLFLVSVLGGRIAPLLDNDRLLSTCLSFMNNFVIDNHSFNNAKCACDCSCCTVTLLFDRIDEPRPISIDRMSEFSAISDKNHYDQSIPECP